MRNIKLNIIEPWECSTEIPVDAVVVAKHHDVYLLYLPDTIQIKAKIAVYLLAEVIDKSKSLDLQSPIDDPISLRMVYSGEVTTDNFKQFNLKDFRGGLLKGEVFSG